MVYTIVTAKLLSETESYYFEVLFLSGVIDGFEGMDDWDDLQVRNESSLIQHKQSKTECGREAISLLTQKEIS